MATSLPAPPPVHPCSIATAIHKGGAGKTSLTANVAGLAAERGYRTLAVDTDPQGNLALDFGVSGTSADDQGAALFEAVTLNRPLRVVSEVRPNLDFVPSGEAIEMLAYASPRDPEEGRLRLRRALATVWDDYDLVIIDSPPLLRPLREMALAAARFAVLPTRGDDASVMGVTGIAGDFKNVRPVNPDLELLGVVLFGMGASSKTVRSQVRDKVSRGLGSIAPVFESEIRYAESPAIKARNSGRLVHELARELANMPRFTDRQGGVTATKLAGDYARLTAEILRAVERSGAATEAGLEAAEVAAR